MFHDHRPILKKKDWPIRNVETLLERLEKVLILLAFEIVEILLEKDLKHLNLDRRSVKVRLFGLSARPGLSFRTFGPSLTLFLASNGQSGSYQGPVKGHIARRFGDRKSRAATGRGLPKKLGGGGAFTWGRPGCEMDTTVEGGEIDPLNDPDIVFDSVSYEPTDEGKE